MPEKDCCNHRSRDGATAHELMAIFGRMRLAMNAHVGDGGQLLLAGPEHDEKEAEAYMQKALSVARRQRFKLESLLRLRVWLGYGSSRAIVGRR
jgi:hypothetical protein